MIYEKVKSGKAFRVVLLLSTGKAGAPPNIFALIAKYILPVREGRTDKRKMKTKSAVMFIYRVAA